MLAVQYIIAFVAAIAILVTVHEFGHYLAARLCGVKILRFSVGFGRVLKSWRLGPDQTEWALSAIPLGGYVKMLDEREGEVATRELHRAFNRQALYKRSIIVLAGPVFNLLLAALIYWGIACVGTRDLPAVIQEVTAGSAFAKAGVTTGDRILEVDGSAVKSWSDFKWRLIDQAVSGQVIALTVDRGGVPVSGLQLDTRGLSIDERSPDPVQQLGATPVLPKIPAVIGGVAEGSPARRAGLQQGDKVVSIDAHPVNSWSDLVKQVGTGVGKTLQVNVLRAGKEVQFTLRPEKDAKTGRVLIGVMSQPDEGLLLRSTVEVRYGLLEGLAHGVRQTWEMSWFSLKVMWRIVTGHISVRNVSGPVTIADYAGKSAGAGLGAYIQFLALISVSIGVLNLLPIPILDGGHLLYHAAEFVRGKPLPERIEEYGQRVGMVLLAGMMALAFFNDFNRFFFG